MRIGFERGICPSASPLTHRSKREEAEIVTGDIQSKLRMARHISSLIFASSDPELHSLTSASSYMSMIGKTKKDGDRGRQEARARSGAAFQGHWVMSVVRGKRTTSEFIPQEVAQFDIIFLSGLKNTRAIYLFLH